MNILKHLEDAALMTAGMIWQTAWSLVLGFTLSALLQAPIGGSLGGSTAAGGLSLRAEF